MIRTAAETDLDEVLALEREVMTAPHWPRDAYARCLVGDGAERTLLLAEDERGKLLGFAAGAMAAGEGELETVVVASEARGRGLGQELCEALLAWCARRGARTVLLEVRASSLGAIRLYERLGFQVTARRAGYYARPDEDALVMQVECSSCGCSRDLEQLRPDAGRAVLATPAT